jgi:hypothetical protein
MRTTDVSDTLPVSLEQLYKAALAVCAASIDVADAADLLDCLGLLDELSPRRIPA